MSVSSRRDVVVVAAFVAGLTLLGGVQASAADAPVLPALPAPTTAPTPTTAGPTTTAAPTTTTAAPATTTTTAPPRNPVDDAIHHWFADDEAKARDVAWCESRHDPRAMSPGGGNHGLFQINNVHRGDFAAVTGVAWEDGRYDAFRNAQFARWLYDRQGWRPWACA